MVTDIPERIPERIGPYEITTPIGRGGMGLILQALRTDLGKPCVIKIMLPELADNTVYCHMFRNEAFVGAQLRHNRIVGVQDFGEHEGRLYLVMDRVDGVNLEQFLEALAQQGAGFLELGLVLYVIEEVLEALAYAHDRMLDQTHDISVIHRDVTPGNIMISSRGEVLLTDFGIARWVDKAGRASIPMGTLLYMAPEQFLGQVTRQSDLYSVGVIFHELLTGSPPLGKVPESARPEALLIEPTPATGRDDVPPEIEELRLALLQKRPEKRLRTAEEGLDMLRRYRGYRARSADLRDLYLRLIGPPSSGWTGYLKSAEPSRAEAPLAGSWLERLRNGPDPSAEPSAEVFWFNELESGADEDEDEDEDDHTHPWEASPPSRDASAANRPVRTLVLKPFATLEKDDEPRTRRFRRVLPRATDDGPDSEGRIDAPRDHRKAALQPVAVVSSASRLDGAGPVEQTSATPSQKVDP